MKYVYEKLSMHNIQRTVLFETVTSNCCHLKQYSSYEA